jgi:hypothetical protein
MSMMEKRQTNAGINAFDPFIVFIQMGEKHSWSNH